MQRSSLIGLLLAISSAGCSDGAPLAAEAAAHYTIGGSCPTQPSYGGIGATEPLEEGGPTGVPELPPTSDAYPTDKGAFIVDGQVGANKEGPEYEVDCTIAGEGDLRLNVKLSGQNSSPWVTDTSKTNITASATIKADGTGTGKVSFFTRDTQNVTGNDCTFKVVPNREGDPDMEPGKMFATFVCPGVTMASMLQPDCEARGTLVLRGCATN